MPATIESLGIDKLSREEQIELMYSLQEYVEKTHTGGMQLSEAQIEELDRRIAEDEEFPDDTVSWEEIQADLKKRRGR